jgi:hypothetical protein
VAVDNRSNDLATYDNAALVELLQSLPDLQGTGYDDAALVALLASVTVPEFEPQDDTTRLDTVDPKQCPSCGFEWRVGARGEIEPA